MWLAVFWGMKTLKSLVPVVAMSALLMGCPSTDKTQSRTAPAPVIQHSTSIRWLPASVRRFNPLIEQASFRHGIDANLLAIVILVESGGDPIATSPKGAMGLMQIMPSTAREIASQRNMLAHVDARLLDPAYNIDFGAYYLSRQMHAFRSNNPMLTVERAAGAYNGGPARMARHLNTGERLPAETMRYKRWVAGMWHDRHLPGSPMFSEWWSAGGERLVARTNGPLVF